MTYVCAGSGNVLTTLILVCRMVEPFGRHEWAGSRTAQYRHTHGGD
jgi:hypothetical protein